MNQKKINALRDLIVNADKITLQLKGCDEVDSCWQSYSISRFVLRNVAVRLVVTNKMLNDSIVDGNTITITALRTQWKISLYEVTPILINPKNLISDAQKEE